MKLYPVFLLVATATVLSPGPGVLMALTNALRYGLRGSIGGILGVACGAGVVAALSATGLGMLMAASAAAFNLMKWLGAAYLVYLGLRQWLAPPPELGAVQAHPASFGRRFVEGLMLQLTNPKVIFFFLSVFPQFIDPADSYALQFAVLVLSYCVLVVAVHCLYALFAKQARRWLVSRQGARWLGRIAGATFIGFGVALAGARR